MGQVATMAVRIDANIDSLTKNLDKAQKAVMKAADHVNELGNKLSEFVTAPALAAGAALAKLASDAEATGERMSRVFGSATPEMQAFLTTLRQSAPQSMASLQQLAAETDNMVKGLGLTPAAATEASKSLLSLANDMRAFKGESDIGPALETLERGLAGQTRGLVQYGIVVNKASIQQEAYREGLLKSGDQLTETGTAIAAFNLIMQHAGSVQGEAQRTAGELGNQLHNLTATLEDVGAQLGVKLLPLAIAFTQSLLDLVTAVSKLPSWVGTLAIALVTLAATAGPLLKLIATLAKLGTLFEALQAAEGIGGIAAAIGALASPIGIAIAAFIALGVAIGAAYELWKHFHSDTTEAANAAGAKIGPGAATTTRLGANAAAGATSQATGSPLDQLAKQVSAVGEAYSYAAQVGGNLNTIFSRAVALHDRIVTSVSKLGNVFDENAQKMRGMLTELQKVLDAKAMQALGLADTSLGQQLNFGGIQLSAGTALGGQSGKLDALASALDAAIARGSDLSGIFSEIRYLSTDIYDAFSQISDPLSQAGIQAQALVDKIRPLLLLNNALGLPYIGAPIPAVTANAPAAAQAQYIRDKQSYSDDLAKQLAAIKLPDYFNAAGEAALQLAQDLRNSQHNLQVTWEEFKQGIRAIIDGTVQWGAAIQAATWSALQFAADAANALASKLSGGGFFGGLGQAFGSGLGMAIGGPIGGAIGAIGGALVGHGIDALGNALFGHSSKAADAATTSLDGLATAATAVSQALSNAPSGFKVAYYEYQASQAVQLQTAGIGPHGLHPMQIYIENINGVQNVNDLYDQLSTVATYKGTRGGSQRLAVGLGVARA